MTEAEFKILVTEIEGAYTITIPQERRAPWWAALRYLDFQDAIAALRSHIADEPKIPRPADIIRRAREKQREQPISESPAVTLARLDRFVQAAAARRLQAGDDREISFQLWKARQLHLSGRMTEEDELYFDAHFGPDWRIEAGIDLSEPVQVEVSDDSRSRASEIARQAVEIIRAAPNDRVAGQIAREAMRQMVNLTKRDPPVEDWKTLVSLPDELHTKHEVLDEVEYTAADMDLLDADA